MHDTDRLESSNKSRTALLAGSIFVLLVLYVLSPGPMVAAAVAFEETPLGDPFLEGLQYLYKPLELIADRCPVVDDFYDSYVGLFVE